MFKEGMLALVGQGFIETIYMTVISTAWRISSACRWAWFWL